MEARDVTCEASATEEVPLPPTLELGATELGGEDYQLSGPPSPLPFAARGVHHEGCTTPPAIHANVTE